MIQTPTPQRDEPRTETPIPASIEQFIHTQLRYYFNAHGNNLPPSGLYDRLLPQLERPLILEALCATRGNQMKAAELLGLNRNTLRKKIRDLGIDVKQWMQTYPS